MDRNKAVIMLGLFAFGFTALWLSLDHGGEIEPEKTAIIDEGSATVRRGAKLTADSSTVADLTHRTEDVGTADPTGREDPKAIGAKDPEWEGYPRLRFNVVRRALTSPGSLKPEKLYRHRKLNAGDVYLTPVQREELKALFSLYAPQIQAATKISGDTTHNDMEKAIASGNTVSIPMTKALEATEQQAKAMEKRTGKKWRLVIPSRQFPDRPDLNVFSYHDGKLHAASQLDLPNAKGAVGSLRKVGSEFGQAVILWFSVQGTCSPKFAAQMVRALIANEIPRRPLPRNKNSGKK